MAVVLIITGEDGAKIEFPIFGKISIGRSSRCDIKLTDGQVSGNHGSFEVSSDGKLFFTDMQTTNGSFLNNQKITQSQIKVGDELRLGKTIIIVDDSKLNHNERVSVGKYNPNFDKRSEELSVPSLKLPVSNKTKTKAKIKK